MLNKIEIVRGTTNTFELTVIDADGNAYAMAQTEKIIFGVKRKATDTERVITKTAVMLAVGTYSITLEPEDTNCLNCEKYVYDVALESGNHFYNIVEPSLFVILPNVTERGCAN